MNFDPKDYLIPSCTLKDIQTYKQVFDHLDDDLDGMLTPMDLRKCIREHGGYKPGRPFVYGGNYYDPNDTG